jgi:hypothetical protein
MATEDFTGYSKNDPNSKFTITAAKCLGTLADNADDCYCYDDKGAGHFDGDFTHIVEMSCSVGTGGEAHPWAVANDIGGYFGLVQGSKDALLVKCRGRGAYNTWSLVQLDGGDDSNLDTSDSNGWDGGHEDPIYCEVDRDEAVGTYGTITVDIYSDSGRSTHEDTLSVTIATETNDFQYIYAWMIENNASDITCYSKDLDLQEAAAGLEMELVMHHRKLMGAN